MTVALWCILIALALPPLCALIAKVSSGRFGLKDNHDPRAFLDIDGRDQPGRRCRPIQSFTFDIAGQDARALVAARYQPPDQRKDAGRQGAARRDLDPRVHGRIPFRQVSTCWAIRRSIRTGSAPMGSKVSRHRAPKSTGPIKPMAK